MSRTLNTPGDGAIFVSASAHFTIQYLTSSGSSGHGETRTPKSGRLCMAYSGCSTKLRPSVPSPTNSPFLEMLASMLAIAPLGASKGAPRGKPSHLATRSLLSTNIGTCLIVNSTDDLNTTSQSCPRCGHQCKDINMRVKQCNITYHRDLLGAENMVRIGASALLGLERPPTP